MSSSTPPLPMETDHFISLEKAMEMTRLYRAEKENILIPEFRKMNILSICETFDRKAFDSLLAQTGCVGLRVYFGMDEDLRVRVITVGVNDKNEDMLPLGTKAIPRESKEEGSDDNNIVETGQLCPDLCPPASPLNG